MGIAIIVIVALLVVIGLWVMVTYNGLVGLKNKVDNGWAQIDVQLRRRYDLIPNLVETVKGYAAHERGTLEAVIEARNAAMTATGTKEQAAAENMITASLRSVFALSEAYPDLKANTSFLNLQEELTGTEGRIAYARQFFNDLVMRFNTKIQTFPANTIARRLGFSEREFFEVEEAARGNVKVDFGLDAPAAPAAPVAAPAAPAPAAPTPPPAAPDAPGAPPA